MKDRIIKIIKKEKVMTIAVVLAAVSSFFVAPDKKYLEYIDWKVLSLLFCLMLVVKGFQDAGLFDYLIKKMIMAAGSLRTVAVFLVCMCFFGSMVITNDVALITFVPFGIITLKKTNNEKYMIKIVVLQTLAANLGSMFTPIGNPQNLYLFSASKMSVGEFSLIMLPYTVFSLIVIIAVILFIIPGEKIKISVDGSISSLKDIIIFFILFAVNLLVVFRILNWFVAFIITVISIIIIRKQKLLKKIDYALLITFMGFFIFIGNIGRISIIKNVIIMLLKGRELIISVVFSQFMSNVPAAILLSGFSNNYRALLLGTDIGGLGTFIASMASLISYKMYAEEEGADKGKYLKTFTIWNIIGLVILLILSYFMGDL